MSANTFTTPAVNGVNGRQNSKLKLADQLNGASTSSYQNGHTHNEEAGLGQVREAARHMVNTASQATEQGQRNGSGLVRAAASTAIVVGEKAVEKTAATLGYGYGVMKAVGSFYINATAAVVGYSAACGAHLARYAVDTTANLTDTAVNKAEETAITGYNKASHLAGYAVGAAGGIAEQTVHVAHAAARKLLPISVVEKAETAAGVAQVALEHPVDTAKELLPAPVYNSVRWGIETAADAKDRTFTTVTSTRDVIRNTATAVVGTTRSKLQATEDFAYGKAVESYENAKQAIGFAAARTA